MEQIILPAQGEVNYAEALELAIEREIKAEFMYRTIAKYSKVQHLINKLRFLADEEQSHKENLQDLFKKIVGKKKDFDSMVKFPDESKTGELAKLNTPELLKIAVEKEKESNAYYVTLSLNSKEQALKDIFNYLAEEEATHRRMLELELKLYEEETPLSRPVETIPGIYRDWW
ncbi:MAG: ferritin family protein [Candidatus Eremiobacteraeota bacterium]|nr:ferritin family protein [Candidatus Eremiobacteraeota bacterium]